MTIPTPLSHPAPVPAPADPLAQGPLGQSLAGTSWNAGFLPPALAGAINTQALRFGDLTITVPAPDASQMHALCRTVAAATDTVLRPMPVSTLIGVVDRAVARLLDPQDPARQWADHLLPRVTGFDAEMVQIALTGYLQQFRAPQLHRFVAQDFANPKVLDEFQPAATGGAVRALGPKLLAHSWAGNVPGLPLWSLACGLLVKAGSIGKLPSAEPVFASLFAQVLAQVHPPLADCLAVVWWKGGDAEPAATLFAAADCVLAYGSNEAIAQVRAHVPATTRFLPYGHKLGLALIGRDALDMQRGPALAQALAKDVTRYEQHGCYSPHVVYVERGGPLAPRDFAQHLAQGLQALAQRHLRPPLALQDAQALAQWRADAELRTLQGPGHALMGAPEALWAVAYSDAPMALAPSAGWRCVQVVAVDSLDAVIDTLAPHALYLQTAAVAVAAARLYPLAERLALAGITRITAVGRMTEPEAGWHHDGSFSLASLVRMVDLEPAAERAADRLAPYAQEGGP